MADGGSTGSTALRGGGSKGSSSFHPAAEWGSCRFGLATGVLLGGILRMKHRPIHGQRALPVRHHRRFPDAVCALSPARQPSAPVQHELQRQRDRRPTY